MAAVNLNSSSLATAITQLRTGPAATRAANYLRDHQEQVLAELRQQVMAQVPAFTTSRDPNTLAGLTRHGPEHLSEILRLLDGGAVGDFDFVRLHACQRAEHRFPLEALLHAYRCGHKVFSHWLRQGGLDAGVAAAAGSQATPALADFALEYTDAISTAASAAYVEQIQLLADVAGDERAQLLNILLGGFDESDARVASILRRSGYLLPRQSFCVVLAQSVDATEMDSPARTRRLAEALDQGVPSPQVRRLIDVRDGKVTAVFTATRRQSGWTPEHASLAQGLARDLATAGNAVLIGISGDVFSTSAIPTAYRQALLALRLASLAQRVVSFADTSLRQRLIHLAGDDLHRLLPPWAEPLHQADHKLGGTLQATVRAYADADMNLLKAAAQLQLHPNTLYARLNRIEQITGLDARRYGALTDLLTVADARVAVHAAVPPRVVVK